MSLWWHYHNFHLLSGRNFVKDTQGCKLLVLLNLNFGRNIRIMPSAINNMTGTLTDLLLHLVRMPTVTSDQRTNRAALDWVQGQLAGLPMRIERLEHGGFPCLIATTTGVRDPQNPKVWLAAHMDVVDGKPSDFQPSVNDDRTYGRGSHDMKFALASYICLLQNLGSSLEDYDLGLLITCDEEVGGQHGVGWLVEERGYRGQAVILPDSSSDWKHELGGKGISWWELTSTGRTGHASRPWQSVNAIDELVKFVANVSGNVPTEPCGNPLHEHATVNFSAIKGGLSINQVPPTAVGNLDIRFTADLNIDDITGWMDAASSAVPSVKATLIRSDLPYRVESSRAADLYLSIAREVTGQDIDDHMAHGSSDARWFAWHDVPTINVGIAGSGYHVSPEWVSIPDLVYFYEIICRFADEWARID